jgi:hypothetical protein
MPGLVSGIFVLETREESLDGRGKPCHAENGKGPCSAES